LTQFGGVANEQFKLPLCEVRRNGALAQLLFSLNWQPEQEFRGAAEEGKDRLPAAVAIRDGSFTSTPADCYAGQSLTH
jgi:hypothetical protein